MTGKQNLAEQELSPLQSRRQIEIIFEFSVLKPKPTLYRGVKSIDGGFRMEKRGENAKKFRPAMWCGSVEGLFKFREAVEYFCRK